MLWNVYDYGGCSFDTVRGGRGLSGRHEACGQTMHGHAADVLMWPMCEAAPPPILPVPPRLPGCLSLVCVVQEGRNLCAAAPLLSLIKQAEQLDVLVPAFKPRYEPQWVPWSEKSDLAFFRWVGGRAGGWVSGVAEWLVEMRGMQQVVSQAVWAGREEMGRLRSGKGG